MKKKPQSQDATPSDAVQPRCWERDPNAQALRVELADGTYFIFPYAHLSFARLASNETKETLVLTYSAHEVTIVGGKLRDLGLAVQKLSADWIKELPKRYVQLLDGDSAHIETIDVKELAAESDGTKPCLNPSDVTGLF